MLTLFSSFVRFLFLFLFTKRFFTVNSTAPLLHKKGTEREKIDSLSNLSVSLSVSFSLVFLSHLSLRYRSCFAIILLLCLFISASLRIWLLFWRLFLSASRCIYLCVWVRSLMVLCCRLCMGACDAGDKGTDSRYTPGEVDAPCQVAVTSL